MNNQSNNRPPSGPQSAQRGAPSVQFHEVKPAALLRLLAQTITGLRRQAFAITLVNEGGALVLRIPGVQVTEAGALVLAEPEPAPVAEPVPA